MPAIGPLPEPMEMKQQLFVFSLQKTREAKRYSTELLNLKYPTINIRKQRSYTSQPLLVFRAERPKLLVNIRPQT